ncbi:unnamed protein product [Closterium sp. NIES-53]
MPPRILLAKPSPANRAASDAQSSASGASERPLPPSTAAGAPGNFRASPPASVGDGKGSASPFPSPADAFRHSTGTVRQVSIARPGILTAGGILPYVSQDAGAASTSGSGNSGETGGGGAVGGFAHGTGRAHGGGYGGGAGLYSTGGTGGASAGGRGSAVRILRDDRAGGGAGAAGAGADGEGRGGRLETGGLFGAEELLSAGGERGGGIGARGGGGGGGGAEGGERRGGRGGERSARGSGAGGGERGGGVGGSSERRHSLGSGGIGTRPTAAAAASASLVSSSSGAAAAAAVAVAAAAAAGGAVAGAVGAAVASVPGLPSSSSTSSSTVAPVAASASVTLVNAAWEFTPERLLQVTTGAVTVVALQALFRTTPPSRPFSLAPSLSPSPFPPPLVPCASPITLPPPLSSLAPPSPALLSRPSLPSLSSSGRPFQTTRTLQCCQCWTPPPSLSPSPTPSFPSCPLTQQSPPPPSFPSCPTSHQALSDNTDFTVLAVLGPPSLGKSSLLNALAAAHIPANAAASGPLGGVFAVGGEEQVLAGRHCSSGVEAHVTSDRLLLIDTQPINSASLLLDVARADGTASIDIIPPPPPPAAAAAAATDGDAAAAAYAGEAGDSSLISAELAHTIMGLQLGVFLFSVCHMVIVVCDGINDHSTWEYIQTVQMLRLSPSESPWGPSKAAANSAASAPAVAATAVVPAGGAASALSIKGEHGGSCCWVGDEMVLGKEGEESFTADALFVFARCVLVCCLHF